MSDLQSCYSMWILLAEKRDLVPPPGIEPGAPAAQVQSPSHWTTQGSPCNSLIMENSVTLEWDM